MQKNHSLTKAIIDAYKMAEEKMLFVDKIRDFVRFKKYKEVSFVFTLFINSVSLVEKYNAIKTIVAHWCF